MSSKGQWFCIGIEQCLCSGFCRGNKWFNLQTNSTGNFIRRTSVNLSQSPAAKENPPNCPEPTLCSAGAKAIILAMEICICPIRANEWDCCTYHAHCAITVHNIHYQHGLMDPYRPIASPLLFQQLKDRLSIHVWRSVQPSDVEDRGSKVNVQHQMGVSEEVHAHKVYLIFWNTYGDIT